MAAILQMAEELPSASDVVFETKVLVWRRLEDKNSLVLVWKEVLRITRLLFITVKYFDSGSQIIITLLWCPCSPSAGIE